MCLLIPSSSPTQAMARPLIYVSANCNEISLWSAETGSSHQVFRVASYDNITEISSIPRALARLSSKPNCKQDMKRNPNSKYRIDKLNEPPLRLLGIHSLLPLSSGDLLIGGIDLKICYWNHTSPERSYSVCGPSIKGLGNDEHYERRSSFGVQIVQISDVGIREMILHTIQLDPEGKLSYDNYLQSYASSVFPSYLSPFLRKFFSCLIPLDSDTRVAMTKGAFSEISKQMMNDRAVDDIVSETSVGTNLIDNLSLQKCESGKENTNYPDDESDPAESMVGKGLQLVDDIASIYREVEKSNSFSHTKATLGNIPIASTNNTSTKSTIFSNQTKHFGKQTLIYTNGKENVVHLFKKFDKNDWESLMARYNIQSKKNEVPF